MVDPDYEAVQAVRRSVRDIRSGVELVARRRCAALQKGCGQWEARSTASIGRQPAACDLASRVTRLADEIDSYIDQIERLPQE